MEFSSDSLLYRLNEVFYSSQHQANGFGIRLFWLGLLLALSLKFIVEYTRGYPFHVSEGTFLYEAYVQRSLMRTALVKLYLVLFFARLPLMILAEMIFWVCLQRVCLIFLAASYFCELFVLFRYHLIVIIVCIVSLVLDESFLTTATQEGWREAHQVTVSSVVYIQSMAVIMYWASVRRKVQYRFYNGIVLSEGAIFSQTKSGRMFPDHFSDITVWAIKYIRQPFSQGLSFLVLIAQSILGLALLTPSPVKNVGIVLGIALHISMMLLFPITLSFFSLLMVSVLMLWL